MTSYQNTIHSYSSFSATTTRKSNSTKSAHNNTYDITAMARAKKINNNKKTTTPVKKIKLYSASGQAPSPSKDFFEISVFENEVIWRKWRIRYARNGKLLPSEEKMDVERFLENDVIQTDIELNLGDDILNMAIGHLTKSWLSRLPMKILNSVTSYLNLKEIGRLHQVSQNLNKRLKNDTIWETRLQVDFGLIAEEEKKKQAKKKMLKKIYREEVIRKKEAEIDWNNV